VREQDNFALNLLEKCTNETERKDFGSVLEVALEVSTKCFILNTFDIYRERDVIEELGKALSNDSYAQVLNEYCTEALPAIQCFDTFKKKFDRCLKPEERKFTTLLKAFAVEFVNESCQDNASNLKCKLIMTFE